MMAGEGTTAVCGGHGQDVEAAVCGGHGRGAGVVEHDDSEQEVSARTLG